MVDLASRVQAAFGRLTTLESEYDNLQVKGDEKLTAKVHLTFAKPRKVRFEFRASSDTFLEGATVVWLGGATMTGRKYIGPIAFKQEYRVKDKPNLRGLTYDQVDYAATVTAFLSSAHGARHLGMASVGDRILTMVEYRSKLPGHAIERIGLDPDLDLPAYRDLRETAGGPIVYRAEYHGFKINRTLAKDAFAL